MQYDITEWENLPWWQQDAYMDGLEQYLEFQVKLADRSSGMSGGGSRKMIGSSDSRMPGYSGQVPDDIPDIGTMVPIERTN